MRPPPDLIKDAEEYEVETIVNHRHFGPKCQLQYLIKWKGYPDADNTWELADHVHAPALIQTYHWRNPLEVSEQDKRGQKKHKVSICSLKSFLQQHYSSLIITCLPSPPTSMLTSSLTPPPPSSTLSTMRPLLHHPQRPLSTLSNAPPIGHLSPLPPTMTLNQAKLPARSSKRVTLSLPSHQSTSSRPAPTSTPTPSAPSPSVWPTRPSATHSNTSRPKARSPSSAT
jgi:Chromo (CHRromatin Organisation MOdifier) domain